MRWFIGRRDPQAGMTRLLVFLIACGLVTSAAAGCTSMKTIRPAGDPPSAPPFHGVQAGDIVSVETRDGRRDRFTVQQIDGDVLVADTGARYPHADIVQLRRRTFSPVRTALLIGGAAFGLLVGEAGGPF
jgi:hypothetical protein